jgi:hypothetical protein
MATLDGHGFPFDTVKLAIGAGMEVKNFGSGVFIPQLGTLPADAEPPVIGNVAPLPDLAPGSPGAFPSSYGTARMTPIELDVTDIEPGLALVVLSCTITGVPGTATVYRDDEFCEGYAVASTATPIAGGLHFEIVRDDGWPAGAEVTIDVDGVDAAGNVTPSGGVVEVTLTSIDVTPAASTFSPSSPSDTRQMTATGHYSNGSTADITGTVTWSTGTPAVATITSGGALSGVTAGTSTVVATLGVVTGSTTISVVITLSSIAVTPANSTWAPTLGTDRQQMVATGTYSNATTAALTTSVTWASSATGVATISNTGGSQGQAAPVANGVSTITATLGAVSGNTQLTLAMVPTSIAVAPTAPTWIPVLSTDRQAFTATATYPSGATANVTSSATWTSGTPSVATVASAGSIAAVLVGASVITATLGAVSGNQTLTIDIPVDATSGKGVPVNAFQWSLVGLVIQNLYLCQEASGNLADSGPGGVVLTANGVPLYQQALPGWTRLTIGFNQTTSQRFAHGLGVGTSPVATAAFWLTYFVAQTAPGGTRGLLNIAGNYGIGIVNTGAQPLRCSVGGVNTDDATTNPVADDLVHPLCALSDPATTRAIMYTDKAKTAAAYVTPTDGTKGLGGGVFPVSPPALCGFTLAAVAIGANVPASDAAVKLVLQRLKWTITGW